QSNLYIRYRIHLASGSPMSSSVSATTHFPQPNPQRRAPRIHRGGSVLALVMLDDGQRAKGKLQTISITGGLLRLGKSLGQGDFVEIAFQTQSGPVLGMAEMLSPMVGTRYG